MDGWSKLILRVGKSLKNSTAQSCGAYYQIFEFVANVPKILVQFFSFPYRSQFQDQHGNVAAKEWMIKFGKIKQF